LRRYDHTELEERKLLAIRNPLSTKNRFTAIVPAVVWPWVARSNGSYFSVPVASGKLWEMITRVASDSLTKSRLFRRVSKTPRFALVERISRCTCQPENTLGLIFDGAIASIGSRAVKVRYSAHAALLNRLNRRGNAHPASREMSHRERCL
jgi:hypothetical protein